LPTLHRAAETSFGQDFDAVLPAASVIGRALLRGLFLTGIVSLLVSFVAAELRPLWLRISLFLLGVLSLVGSNWGNSADLATLFIAKAILLAVVILGVRRIMRFNILGCFLVIAVTTLLSGVAELMDQPDPFYRTNGSAVLLAFLVLLVWPVAAWRRRSIDST
jgi:hypothetical protein